MKAKALKHQITLAILTLLLTSCFSTREVYSQGYGDYYEDEYYYADYDRVGVNFNVFYNELRPHGRWINNGRYGRVWVPNVGRNFHPYATNGYWVMTDYGNTWVSDYSWGWAPFHYGRWYYDDFYGWAWVPGYEWAPAWVSWRSGGGYYGWAPMGPGININININIPGSYWTFLPHKYMYHRNMKRYYNRYSPAIYNKTTIINNTYIYNDNRYYSGPTVREYEQTTGRKATVMRLESTDNRSARNTRVSNNIVSVYRPESGASRNTNRTSTINSTDRSSSTNRNSTIDSNNRSSSTNRNATVNPANRSTTTNRNATAEPANRNTTTNRSSTAEPANRSTSTNRSSTVNSESTNNSNNNTRVSPSRTTSSNRTSTAGSQSSTSSNSRSTTVRSSSSSTNNRSSSSGSGNSNSRNTETSSRSSSGRR
ncbi:MAG: DUF6600 domain-containing protein [Bacteroidales bacterium]